MRLELTKNRRPPRGLQRTDERIREDVCERLLRDPWIDASEIDVRVQDGDVYLEGEVDTRDQRWHAEDLAADVPGVRDVMVRVRTRAPLRGAPPWPHHSELRHPIETRSMYDSRLTGFRTGFERGGVGRRPGW